MVKLSGAAALGALAALFAVREVRAQDAPSPASQSAEQAEAQPIEVTIEGDKAPPGAVSLGRKQIQEMPGVLADPYRAIEVEPGVTPLTSGVPFYFVRGAPPGNVGYFFDGIQVPMLFHVGAGPGVIPSALVQRVELHLGPYPASFGRLAGAIVDAESAPARSDWHGEGVMRVVDMGGLVEGPLPNGAGSLLAGGHYAIGAEILSALVPAVDISYWDYQARGSFKVSERGRLGVLAFGAYDYLATVEGDVRDVLLDSDFHRVDLRYDHELDDGGSLRVSTTLGLDRSRGLGVQDARDTRLHSRVTFKRPLGGGVLLRGGLDVALDVFDVVPGGAQECTTFLCDSGGLGSSTESELAEAFEVLFPSRLDLAVGGWVDALVVLSDRATLTPGLRVDYYHSLGRSDVAVDPKLAGRFGIGEHFRLVPAVGVASQLPGFPPLPGLQIGGIPGGLQRALQTSFGAEGDAGPIDVRGSVFRHATFNLTDAIGARRGQSFGPERFLGRSTGDAYGLELTARGALSASVFFLASYTLSRTTREIEGVRLPSAYDRTHVAQVAFLSDLGKNWKIGFRSLFYTGFPAEESGSGVEPTTDPERVKPFFRLDARLSKRWVFGERAYVGLVFDVQNATLSKEVFDVTCEDGRCEPREIGPIAIPTMVFEAGY